LLVNRAMHVFALPAVLAVLALGCATTSNPLPPPDGAYRDDYLRTPGAHSERPGKHSTTTGRHGTTGTVGGGIDTQSGTADEPTHPTTDQPTTDR
jgi:hypothetical protein